MMRAQSALLLLVALAASCRWGEYDGTSDAGPPAGSFPCNADGDCPSSQRCVAAFGSGNGSFSYVCVGGASCMYSPMCTGMCGCTGPTRCAPDNQCRTPCVVNGSPGPGSPTCLKDQSCIIDPQAPASSGECHGTDPSHDPVTSAGTVVAQNQPVSALAAANGRVIWGNSTDPHVFSCMGVCTGMPMTLTIADAPLTAIATDGASVYMTTSSGSVLSCPIGGCGQPLALQMTGQSPAPIAVGAGGVAWIEGSSADACMTPVAPGCTKVLFTAMGPLGGVAIDTGNGNTYFTAGAGILLCGVGGCGGAPMQVHMGGTTNGAIAAAGGVIYWADNTGAINMCTEPSCGNPRVFAHAMQPSAIVADVSGVFWVDTMLGTVSTCMDSGCGQTKTVLTGLQSPRALALDLSNVYVGESQGPQRILSLPRH